MKNKTVFITGASSGIGLACAELFASLGARLILCSRNSDKLESCIKEILKKYTVDIFSFELDVRKQKDVEDIINKFPIEWQEIDILINNAGLARGLEKIQNNLLSDWDEMIDTNVKGLLYITRAILPNMLKRNSGHIVNIGSTAGRGAYPNGAVYCASKAAVRTLSDGIRMDLVETPIRVTVIEPGMVETEFSIVRFHGDLERAKNAYKGIKPLSAMDVAETVIFACNRPAHVHINEICLTPTHQASAMVVHRKT
jgi:3-hydroxy acid dehydrogenase/malonic semialdehyde reductase